MFRKYYRQVYMSQAKTSTNRTNRIVSAWLIHIMSVCLKHSGTVSKWLNISSKFLCCSVALLRSLMVLVLSWTLRNSDSTVGGIQMWTFLSFD